MPLKETLTFLKISDILSLETELMVDVTSSFFDVAPDGVDSVFSLISKRIREN